jgi:surface protein
MSFIVNDLSINTIENSTRKIDLSGSGTSLPFNYYLVSFENGTVKNSSQTILNIIDASFIGQQTVDFDFPFIYFTPNLNFSGSSVLQYKIINGDVSSNIGNIYVETFTNIGVDEISPIAPDINIQILSKGNSNEIFNIDFNNVTSNFTIEHQQFYIFNIPYFRYDQNSETLFYPTYPGFLTDLSTNSIIHDNYTDISSNYVQYTWPGNPYFGTSQFSYFFQELSGNEFISNVGIVTITFSYEKLDGCDTGPGPNPTRLWNRLIPDCPTGFTPQQLDERRKAEIFKYKKNSSNFSKKMNYSRLARGIRQRGNTFATQSASYTNPNTLNLPLTLPNGPLICPNSKKNFAFSWQNDVPGPSTKIALNSNVPLTRYMMPRTFQAGGTKWPQYGPLPYEIPPQFNFFSIPLPISAPFVLDLSFDYHSLVPFEIFLDGVINTNEPLTYQILTIPPDGSGVVLDSNFNKITSSNLPYVLPGNSFQIEFVPYFISNGTDYTDNTSFTYNAISSSDLSSNIGTVYINIDVSNDIIDDSNIYQLVDQWITDRNAPQFSDNTHYPYFGNINTWNVSLVTDMSGLFKDKTDFGTDPRDQIYNWNISNVTNITGMFYDATNFNGSLNTVNLDSYVAWDVSNITDLEGVFRNATNFNGNITDWNVKNVTNFTGTFYHTNLFNQQIGNWDLSSAQNLSNMFNGAVSFNQPLNNWNVSNVTTMENMFIGAEKFNQPIENWNVSNVTTMESMFYGAVEFYQSINIWDTASVTNYNNMFYDANIMISEYTGYEGFGKTPTSAFFNIDADTFPFLKSISSSANIETGTATTGESIVYIKGGDYMLKPATSFSLYQLFLVGGGMDGAARAGGNGGQVIDKSYSSGKSITKSNIFSLHTGQHLNDTTNLYNANQNRSLYHITTPNNNDNTTAIISNSGISFTAYSGNGAYGGAGWNSATSPGPEAETGTQNIYTGLYYGGGGGRCKVAKVAGSSGGLGGGGGGGGSYEGQGTGSYGYPGGAGGGIISGTPGGAGGAVVPFAVNAPGNPGADSNGGGGGGSGSNTQGISGNYSGGTGGSGTSPGGGNGGDGGNKDGNPNGASGGGGGGGAYTGGGGGAGGQGGGEGKAQAYGGQGSTGIIILVYRN